MFKNSPNAKYILIGIAAVAVAIFIGIIVGYVASANTIDNKIDSRINDRINDEISDKINNAFDAKIDKRINNKINNALDAKIDMRIDDATPKVIDSHRIDEFKCGVDRFATAISNHNIVGIGYDIDERVYTTSLERVYKGAIYFRDPTTGVNACIPVDVHVPK